MPFQLHTLISDIYFCSNLNCWIENSTSSSVNGLEDRNSCKYYTIVRRHFPFYWAKSSHTRNTCRLVSLFSSPFSSSKLYPKYQFTLSLNCFISHRRFESNVFSLCSSFTKIIHSNVINNSKSWRVRCIFPLMVHARVDDRIVIWSRPRHLTLCVSLKYIKTPLENKMIRYKIWNKFSLNNNHFLLYDGCSIKTKVHL